MNQDPMELIKHGLSLKVHERDDVDQPFIVIGNDQKVQGLDHLNHEPVRIEQQIEVSTEQSFYDYLNKFKLPSTMIVCVRNYAVVKAYIDYHDAGKDEAGVADYGDHQASKNTHKLTLKMPLSRQWQRWQDINKEKLSQVRFAEFIEDNISDIAEPSSADLLTDVTNFRLVKKATFGSKVNLHNGEFDFHYKTDGDPNGSVKLPEKIYLGIPVFDGGKPYKVEIRLRYRVSDEGDLKLWFELSNDEDVYDDAFDKVVSNIKDKYSDLLVLNS